MRPAFAIPTCLREPATGVATLPPRTRLPALFRFVHALAGEARPIVVIRALFACGREGPNAACRLLQSMRLASTIRDRPNLQHRTPSRPWGAARSRAVPFDIARAASGYRSFEWLPAEISRVRDLASRPVASTLGASRRDHSRARASPQPDWLGHLMSPARDGNRLEKPSPSGSDRSPGTSKPGARRFRHVASRDPPKRCLTGQGRIVRSSAKRSALRRTRGAFHRRINPFQGSPRPPQTVPSLWIAG